MNPRRDQRDTTCAMIAIKPFGDAKERLATGLDPAQRRQIAEAMARDVIAAIAQCTELDEIVIVSREPAIAEIAEGVATAVLEDPVTGHNDAAKIAAAWAAERGCKRIVMLPGDCPLLDPDEIDELVRRSRDDRLELAVIPDRMGTGTNALVISPPDAVDSSFGPDSRQRHIALGLSRGLRTAALDVKSLALDLDTSEDLFELAERLSAADHDAVNTEAVIATLMTDRRRLPGGYAR